MADIKISVINTSTVLKDEEIKPVVDALQTQVTKDFAPIWGIDADLTFIPKGQTAPQNTWWLSIMDNSDVANALGYHDVTDQGLPLGKVFAGSDISDGVQWSVTASHELLEMLADPEINLTVFIQPDDKTGILYAYETCDAVEADEFGYNININNSNILVSDFVTPAYFEIGQTGSTKFDFTSHLKKPVPELLPGGYLSEFNVTASSGWQQITNQQVVKGMRSTRARVGSRRERRRLPRNQWLTSVLKK